MQNGKKALIAMSGGVDSSVAACLMKQQGYTCMGVTMKLYDNEEIGVSSEKTCCTLKDVEDASEISDELKECAEVIAQTDLKMLALRRKIEDRESRENPLKFDKDLP